jgi:hypothetical protein
MNGRRVSCADILEDGAQDLGGVFELLLLLGFEAGVDDNDSATAS